MDLLSFSERVASLCRANNGTQPLVQGMTLTGLLLACFDQGERGVTTITANNGVENDHVITFDEKPWRIESPDYQEIRVAAIATKQIALVDSRLKASHPIRRSKCGTTVVVGYERASFQSLNAWYLELTTKSYPDGSRITSLGDLAVHPFQNFAG